MLSAFENNNEREPDGMNPETTAEMRATLAKTGVRQADIAEALGMSTAGLSRVLNDQRPMPEGFEPRFWSAVRDRADEIGRQWVDEARDRARRLLDAIPSAPAVAA